MIGRVGREGPIRLPLPGDGVTAVVIEDDGRRKVLELTDITEHSRWWVRPDIPHPAVTGDGVTHA